MAPPVVIVSVRDFGPTDNGADDTLYLVGLREGDDPPETVRFSVAQSQGHPSDDELRRWIELRASGFANNRGVVAQFRDLELPHGRDRRVVFLRAPLD
jgi:hypothetical protein